MTSWSASRSTCRSTVTFIGTGPVGRRVVEAGDRRHGAAGVTVTVWVAVLVPLVFETVRVIVKIPLAA